jgi:AcrR family transcriptional regulator
MQNSSAPSEGAAVARQDRRGFMETTVGDPGRAVGRRERSPAWDQKRREILDVSAGLFASKGVDRTSMDDIGRACGLEKPSLYHYFSSKRSIVAGILALGVDDLIADAHAVLESGVADPTDRLARLLQAHSRNFDRKLPHVKVFLLEARGLDGPELQKYLDRRREYEHLIIDAIRDGQEAREFRPGDPTILAYGVLGMFNWMVQWYDPMGRTSAEEIGELLVEAAIGAVRADPPTEVDA